MDDDFIAYWGIPVGVALIFGGIVFCDSEAWVWGLLYIAGGISVLAIGIRCHNRIY